MAAHARQADHSGSREPAPCVTWLKVLFQISSTRGIGVAAWKKVMFEYELYGALANHAMIGA